MNIYLLRHGETSYNADGNKYCGRTDIPLTEKGIKQAEAARKILENVKISKVYSSPLQRALQTAEIVSKNRDVVIDDRLIEVDFGNWEGKTREEFIKENSSLWEKWNEDPTHARAGGIGETASEIIERADSFYSELKESSNNENILVVAHNGINRLYLAHKLGMNLKDYRRIVQENSSITLFTIDENHEFFLRLLNSKGV